MKCLYCDEEIKQYSLYSLFIEKDLLCINCRNKMSLRIKEFNIRELKCEYFYDYDSLFKTMLLQYKECYDEALKDVFLYRIDDYIRFKYHNYHIVYVPSSQRKQAERGFNHLELIFDNLKFKEIKGLRMKEELVQEGKGITDRKMMLDNYIYDGKRVNKLLIVDDVCTTGSSLYGVYKAFKGKADTIRAIVLGKKESTFIK